MICICGNKYDVFEDGGGGVVFVVDPGQALLLEELLQLVLEVGGDDGWGELGLAEEDVCGHGFKIVTGGR